MRLGASRSGFVRRGSTGCLRTPVCGLNAGETDLDGNEQVGMTVALERQQGIVALRLARAGEREAD